MMPDFHNLRPGAEYVSVKEAAVRAKLTPRTIYMWIRNGKVRAFGHGHGTRVLMGEILAPRIPKGPKRKKKRPAEKRSDIKKESAPPSPENHQPGRSLVGLTIPERTDPSASAPSIGSDNAD